MERHKDRTMELEFTRFEGHFFTDEGECFHAENGDPVPGGI